ncbi:MAG TPA: 1-acyl-sn-glycerol-3-phosphate acyltransferase [Bacteriovoracaceae bacterium]|nr:1-acyl-sn-glycerol-3-phosphate acyltransferase [Bacteriovoracaceae bacterium]
MIKKICHHQMLKRGWRFINNVPEEIRSFVVIGAPHTSNWDFFAAMFAFYNLDQKGYTTRFVIKKEWTEFPFTSLMKSVGAWGLDREKVASGQFTNTTDLMSSFFKEEKNLILAIAPEGTRKPTETWKTGFYHTAVKAGVPIVLGFVDYSQKVCGLGKIIFPSSFEVDMKEIMSFYQRSWARIPENYLPDKRFLG